MNFAEEKPILGAIAYNIIFGFAYLPLKFLTEALQGSTSHLLSLRFGICFLGLWLMGKTGVITLRKIRQMWRVAWPPCLMYVLSSFFEPTSLLFYPTGKASVILALAPLFSTIFAVFIFREKPTSAQIACMLVSFMGVAVVNEGGEDAEATTLGFILCLAGAISTAMLNNVIRKSGVSLSPWELSYIMSFTIFVVYGTASLIQFGAAGDILGYVRPLTNIKVIGSLFFLSIISSLYANSLRNVVMEKMQMAKATSFTGICTVTAILAGVIFLHEQFEQKAAIGTIIVLLGVLGVNLCKRTAVHTANADK